MTRRNILKSLAVLPLALFAANRGDCAGVVAAEKVVEGQTDADYVPSPEDQKVLDEVNARYARMMQVDEHAYQYRVTECDANAFIAECDRGIESLNNSTAPTRIVTRVGRQGTLALSVPPMNGTFIYGGTLVLWQSGKKLLERPLTDEEKQSGKVNVLDVYREAAEAMKEYEIG